MWRSGTNRRADKIDLQHDGDDVDGNVGRHVPKVFLGLLELKLHHVQEPQTLERGLVFHNVRYDSSEDNLVSLLVSTSQRPCHSVLPAVLTRRCRSMR